MRSFTHLLQVLLLLALVAIPLAGNSENGDQYLLSERTYNRLNAIQKLMDEGSYQRAEQDLDALLGDVRDKAYEAAVVHQTLGYVYSSTDRYADAAEAFIKAVESRALPPDVTHNLNYNIAQLLIHAGNYSKGLLYLDNWLADEPSPPPTVHVLAATAYYQLKKFRELIPHIRKAINLAENPEQSWFDLLLAAYLETGDYRNAAELLTDLLERYPDTRDYWLQLVGVYNRMDKPEQSLAAMELALKKGVLNEDEIIQLAQMYLQADLPYKAARLLREKIDENVIEDSRDNLELLANSWQLARETERAADTLEQLTEITNDSGVYYRLGQLYFELERWQESIETLEKAAADGSFEKQGRAALLAGIAAYHLEDYTRSGSALKKALGFENTRKQAEWWLDKLESPGKSDSKG